MDPGSDWILGAGVDEDALAPEELEHLVDAKREELRSLVDAVGDILLRLDHDGRIEFVNEAVESTLGFSREQVVDESVDTLVDSIGSSADESASSLTAALSRHDDQETLDVTFTTVEETVRPMRLSWSAVGGRNGYICLARDISEQRRQKRERDQYAQLVEAVGDPIYVLDAEGYIDRVNDAMVEYTGYERTELVGRAIGEIIPSREYDRAMDRLSDLADADERNSETFETTLVTKDGELILTEANVTVLTDEDGAYTGSVGALRDIRERKQRERDLDMLKQVLSRVFRHNVRNELTVVHGNAEHVHYQVEDGLREYTKKIMERTEQLLDHTEKARLMQEVIDTDDRYETDLASVADSLQQSLRSDHPDAAIEVDVPEETTVEAHAEIGTAIEELVDNAIRHADDDHPWVRVWTDETDEFLTLFVEDESGGLDDHEIDVLREGAESDLQHGSGVGLWLVRWVVDYSGADMIAHRTDDGSLMGIRFPRSDQEAEEETDDIEDSPFARVPAHVREDITPERFHGETVIGRMEELHQLEDAYGALERKGGQAVLVTGETGVGKSTLVEQFRERVTEHDKPPLLASGSCESEMTRPYHVFREAMADLPVETALQELLTDIAEFDADDPEAVQHRKQALFADIAEELRDLALDNTVVLVVEDLQWADRGTLDLLEYLIEEVGRWAPPILFVGTYRMEDIGAVHPVRDIAERTADAGRGRLIELEPFDPVDVRNLLEYMLDLEDIPAEFIDKVYDHTGGTPLFVAELGRHLAETLSPSPSIADLPETLADVSAPETVESALTERLDSLAGPVTSVLQLGAVVGETISFDVLREASDHREADLLEYVDNLVQRRIWERTGGTLRFVHGVLRENVLENIDDDQRTTIHGRVARAIETVHADELEDHYGRLATHYDAAGDLEPALDYYREAGRRARETYAHYTAIEQYERALEITDTLDADEKYLDVGHRLAEIHLQIGEYEQADHYVDLVRERIDTDAIRRRQQMAHLAAKIATERGEYDRAQAEVNAGLELDESPSEERCRLLYVAVEFQQEQGKYEQAHETAQRQLDLATDLGNQELRAAAIHYLGILEWRQGNIDQAREYTQQCLSLAEELDDQKRAGDSYHFLGVIAWGEGEYDPAQENYEESLSIKREIGDRHGEAKTLNNLGLALQQQGEYEQAQKYYEQCLETYRELGDRHGEAKTLNNLGIVSRIQGAYDQAHEYYERCLETERDIGDRHGEAKALLNRGEVERQQGRYEQARDSLEESLSIVDDIESRRDETETLTHLGFVAYRQREYEQACEHFEASLAIAREIGTVTEEISSLRGLAAISRQQEEYDQSRQYLDEAFEQREECDDPLTVAQLDLDAGRWALRQDDTESAREHVDQARETFSELGATHWWARSRDLQAQIAATEGSMDDARGYWDEALAIFLEVGAPQDALATLERLVESCRELGEEEQANEWLQQAQDVLADAPEPVAVQHESWVEEHATDTDGS